MKICKTCNRTLSENMFFRGRSDCKDCYGKKMRERYIPKKQRTYKPKPHKKTDEELLDELENEMEICAKENRVEDFIKTRNKYSMMYTKINSIAVSDVNEWTLLAKNYGI